MPEQIINGSNKPMYFGVDLIPTDNENHYLGAPDRKWKAFLDLDTLGIEDYIVYVNHSFSPASGGSSEKDETVIKYKSGRVIVIGSIVKTGSSSTSRDQLPGPSSYMDNDWSFNRHNVYVGVMNGDYTANQGEVTGASIDIDGKVFASWRNSVTNQRRINYHYDIRPSQS